MGALAVALFDTRSRSLAVLFAFICFFLAGTTFSRATRFKDSLRPFVTRTVRIEVWGARVPDAGLPALEIVSVSSFGAGLLIRLRSGPGSPQVLLKIAQPASLMVRDDRIEISDAAYVSFAGRKLQRTAMKGVPALTIVHV